MPLTPNPPNLNPSPNQVDLSYLCISDAGGVSVLCGLRALTSVNLEGCPLCTEACLASS